MPEYRVTWEMDVDAGTPELAARVARVYQRDPEAIVGVFSVREHKTSNWGKTYLRVPVRVDLDAIDGRYDTSDEDSDD